MTGRFTDSFLRRVFAACWLVLGVALVLAPSPAEAVTKTWSGAGADSNWATVANWVGGVAPVSGDDLVFPAAAARLTNVNNLAAATTYLSLSFQGAGYSISGNSLNINSAAGITVSAGVSGTITISFAIPLGVNQTWTVTDAGATLEVSGVISGSSKTLTKAGAGTLKISGAASNTYTGVTTVNAGTLLLNKTAGFNAFNGTSTINSGLVQLLASNQIPNKRVTIVSPGQLDLNNFSETIDTVTMTGGTITTGTGTLTLGGTVTTNAAASSALISGNLALGANRTFTISDGIATDDLLITAVVSGAFNLTKGGAGTLALAGNNSYTGITTINNGQVIAAANNALGTSAGATSVTAGTTLGIRGGITYSTAEPVTIRNTGLAAAGALSNVSGNNSFAGLITLATGSTISTPTAGDTLTLTGTIANGGVLLTVSGAGNSVSNGVISGTGGLTKTGTGSLTLSAANLYSGATAVNVGTLLVTNASGSPTGTGTVTVASGATIGGSNAGAITGTSTVSNGGILSPGIGGAGTLRTGILIENATSNLNFDLGSSSDQAQVTGNLTLDGILNVTALAGFGAGTYTLFTYTGALTNNTVSLGTMPAGLAYSIDVSTAGQVNLRAHPTVASIVRAGTDPTNASSVGFTVTFSTSVTGVDATDFALTTTGGIAGASITGVSGSGTTYTVTVNTGSGSGTIRLDVSDNNSIAAGGNPLGGPAAGDGNFTSGSAYTIDKTAPTVSSSNRADPNPSGAASVAFTVTFSETVTGVDATDFALTTTGVSGASITGVSGSGTTYTVTVNTGSGSGTIRLDATDNDSILDSVGNPLGGVGAGNGNFTTGQTYTLDKTSPTVAMSSTTANPTNVSPIPVTVAFSTSVTGFIATDIVVANGTVNNFAGSGANYSFDLTPTANGLVTADIAAGVAVDSQSHGNLAAVQFARTFDSVAPTVVSSNRAAADPTNAASVNYTVTFSEAVTGVDSADFALTTTGVSGASITGVSGSGSVYTVTVNTGSGSGTIRLDVSDNDSVIDAAGNRLGGTGLGNGNFTAGQLYTIDKGSPTVSMTSTALDPTNVSPIPVTVTFSESVTGFISSDITTSNATVNNFAGSGASYTFDLTPGTNGPVTADIAAGVAADASGNGNLAAPQFSRTYDTVASTVLNVLSTVSDGTYGLGFTIPILVSFSEPVTVTGTPTLTLETGASDAVVNYSSGSGTATLTFNYTVAAGHTSADLDYQSTSALALSGGTIKDSAGNNADLTLFATGTPGSLGDNNQIVIDSTVPAVSNVSSTLANGSYGAGTTVAVTVTFSQAVTVTGTPQLTLNTSSAPNGVASYASGSGTTALVFNYTVAAGQNAPDLDYLSDTALALNGGTIRKNATVVDAFLTLADPGTIDSLGFNKAIVIDTAAPTITSVTSTTANGTYGPGAAINVTVNFSEPVTLAGGNLNVTLDTGAVVAIGPFGPASSASATYTVAAGQYSLDLNAVSPLALAVGATLRDPAGNNSALAIPAGQNLADSKAIIVFTPLTLVKSSAAYSDPFNGTTNPKRIPGGFVTYTIVAANPGTGTVDSNTVIVFDAVPANTELFVGNFGGAGSGPVAFSALTSGLSFTFTSLASTTDDVGFSSDGGTSYTYTPVPNADGVDPAVTHIRINPKGTFAAASSCQLQFRVRVK